MQITQSSVKVVGGSTNFNSDSNSNIGLIVGICIPLGILSNFYIYFCSYCWSCIFYL
jgi:hypothetical protein